MAARSRPRQNAKDDAGDAHEERNMWLGMVAELKKLRQVNQRATEIATEISRDEEIMCGDDDDPTFVQLEALQEKYREGLRLAEEESKGLKEDPNAILESLQVLIALRAASENAAAVEARAQDKKSRNNPKRKIEDTIETPSAVSSPAPLSAGSRTKSTFKEVAPSEAGKGLMEKYATWLVVGSEVAYKNKPKNAESDWITCEIKSISGDGSKRKYEIQDIEPDGSGSAFQAWVKPKEIIPIPPIDAIRDLPELPKGRHVLARYPETTTFYKAELTGTKKDGTICRLKFEGEEEANKEMEVERRYVLDVNAK